jgi:surface protein
MNNLFYDASDFRDDISQWDVSNVTDMSCLFCDAHSFNCDVSNWETGKVRDMDCIFSSARSFRCDVSEWDVSSVDNMNGAFRDCPVDFSDFWEEHKDDPDWKEQCKQDRELRREQRRRDENWERRRPWMMVISPFLKQKGITESPIQSVFNIPDLARHINRFV